MQKVIAMDGPSGSGKSTMAKKLAASLNVLYIDTGAMYRGLAYFADKKVIPFEEGVTLNDFLSNLEIEYGKEEKLISIDGVDLTHKIREHHVSSLASQFSQLPTVRKFLIDFQRELGRQEVCVMEGRDIATVVFPEAFCKIFVTASPEVRAKRRLDQLISNDPQTSIDIDQVLKDVIERDRLDTEREVSPLKIADDATVLDTSNLDEESVLEELKKIAIEAGSKKGIEF